MFPLLGIIVAFLIGLAYPGVRPQPVPVDLTGAAAVLLVFAAGARILTDLAVRRILSGGESASPEPLIRAGAAIRLGTLVAYAVAVYGYHWPRVVALLGIEGWILLPSLVVLLPFFLLLAVQIHATWHGDRKLGIADFRLGEYLSFQLRQYLLPTLPVLAFVLVQDLFGFGYRRGVAWVADLRILYLSYPFLQWMSLAVLLLGLYAVVPFLMRLFWKATPLPDGPIRDRLTEFSRRVGFKARDILVWPTGGNVVNAAVIGIAGPVRYVLVTDGLLDTLPPDEVEAVFAHEVGHAKHNHMLLFFLFTIAFTILMFLLKDILEAAAAAVPDDPGAVALLFMLGGFLAWFGILFGFVSRRFEQQADVYGALATGKVHADEGEPATPSEHPFVRALTGLANEMGDMRESKGWRHFPLGERIDFLRDFLSSEATRKRYRRRMATLLVFFFGVMISLGAAAASTIPRQVREGRVMSLRQRAAWLHSQGREAEAIEMVQAAAKLAERTGVPLPGLVEEDRDVDPRERTMRILDRVRTPRLHPLELFRGLFQLAEDYLALEQYGAARSVITDALVIFGDQPDLLELYGVVLTREGRPGGARLAYHDALALVPADSAAAKRLKTRLAALPDAR